MARAPGAAAWEYQGSGPVTPATPRPLTEAERQQFLADKHVAVLSVAAADGRPPASVPIWYGYTPGGDILISTGSASRKARLIRAAGVVTVVVQREEVPYRYVIVEGTVVETTEPTPSDIAEAIATRYLGKEGAAAFANEMGPQDNVLFTIRPVRWQAVDFSDEL